MVIESDSLSAIRLINEGCSSIHPLCILIREVQSLLKLEKEFFLGHILREANSLADCFAKNGMSLVKCSKTFYSIPSFAVNTLRVDGRGTDVPLFL